MSVYYYKDSGKNMVIQATLQTKLACATLMIIIVNVCFIIAVIAFISKEEMCRLTTEVVPEVHLDPFGKLLETTIAEHPWMLAFVIFPNHQLIGGATIISKNWALTTSDCIEKASTYSLSQKAFRGGSSYWNNGGFYHFPVKLILHEKFDPNNLDYNIALAQVDPPFINAHEIPLSIAGKKFKLGQGFAEVVGWPEQKKDKGGYRLLRHKVHLASEEACNKTLTSMKNDAIAPRSLCTYTIKSEATSCIFVSGGTLITNNSIIGIISWGVSCNENRWPGIHINIKKVINWIGEIKKKENIAMEIDI